MNSIHYREFTHSIEQLELLGRLQDFASTVAANNQPFVLLPDTQHSLHSPVTTL